MNNNNNFTIEDATYAYEIIGEGKPVVLLHGFTGSRKTWKKIVDEGKSGIQWILIDLPGHGDTKTESPRTMEACCHDLATLFSHEGIADFHLVGYSLGGRVALSFAMLYSELLLSLTIESASPGLKTFHEQKDRKQVDEQWARKIQAEGLEAFVNEWENLSLFTTQKALPEQIRKEIRAERLSQTEEGLAQSLRWMGTGIQPSWWNQLSRLKLPVLLIVGAWDEKFVTMNKEMEKYLPNGCLKMIPEAGHAVHLEKPDLFRKTFQAFLESIVL